MIKDSLLLLVTGIVCSGLAWAFWHYLGNEALSMIVTLSFAATAADNFRLRRRLREYEKKQNLEL
jgi:membrane protease YdiL (CAAX protease family)